MLSRKTAGGTPTLPEASALFFTSETCIKIYQAMKRNDSPMPIFETDGRNGHFLATMPIHRAFVDEKAYLASIGKELDEGGKKDGKKDGRKELSDIQLTILSLIENNVGMTTIHKFENGTAGNISLSTFILLLKVIGQVDALEDVLPELPDSPYLIRRDKKKAQRIRHTKK